MGLLYNLQLHRIFRYQNIECMREIIDRIINQLLVRLCRINSNKLNKDVILSRNMKSKRGLLSSFSPFVSPHLVILTSSRASSINAI
jgi:hypothetical protein